LLLASALWGLAFVAQRVGSEHVGTFTFTGVRFALGALVLAPLILVSDRVRKVPRERGGQRPGPSSCRAS